MTIKNYPKVGKQVIRFQQETINKILQLLFTFNLLHSLLLVAKSWD